MTSTDIPASGLANAAIYYQVDAFNAGRDKVMGRHMAGATFLDGFVRHAKTELIAGTVRTQNDADGFHQQVHAIAAAHGLPKPNARALAETNHQAFTDIGCVFLPDPGIQRFAWPRRAFGQRRYSLCGITHTIASAGPMDQFGETLLSPLQSWDAIICTSRSVRHAVEELLDGYGDYLAGRLGQKPRTVVQLPIIPLGTDGELGDQRRGDAAARANLRQRLGIGDNDVVILFFGRLSFHAKAHPAPMMAAVEQAARACPERKIHLFMTGQFFNEAIQQTFHTLAGEICRDTTCHFLDGADSDIAEASWSAADIFLSLSDNIQESFGLTPLEAMAAGLPCVVSDWDGYRDTVVDGETGFLIPSAIPPTGGGAVIANRFFAERINYDHYIALTSQVTAVDIPAATAALIRLIMDSDLRQRMGAAGRQRIAEVFDWAHVVRQYQELWAELASRRQADTELGPLASGHAFHPLRPDPFAMFRHHATASLPEEAMVTGGRALIGDVSSMIEANHFVLDRGLLLPVDAIEGLLRRVDGKLASIESLRAEIPESHWHALMFTLSWLYKFGLIEVKRDAHENPE